MMLLYLQILIDTIIEYKINKNDFLKWTMNPATSYCLWDIMSNLSWAKSFYIMPLAYQIGGLEPRVSFKFKTAA